MSPIEHVWDALDLHVRQYVPVPSNIQQLRAAIEEEWDNIPQVKINSLINSMRRSCATLHKGKLYFRLRFKVRVTIHIRVRFKVNFRNFEWESIVWSPQG